MAWQFDPLSPVYVQLSDRLRCEILQGKYKPGEQFPSVRNLAVRAAVNPNTVQRALGVLEEEGILFSKGTSGRYVTEDGAVLEECRKKQAQSLVAEWLMRAKSLSVDRDELIRLLQEGGEP